MSVPLPIYLDDHATTRLDPRVLEAMLPYLTGEFGNAASVSHVFGWKAEAAVTAAREILAEALSGTEREIVFTSGATESDNLALLGAARLLRSRGDHLVTTEVEHPAVLDPCRQLAREGFRVTYVKPDRYGVIGAGSVSEALETGTILVSVMSANNEIGTLNPIGEIGRLCKEKGVLFHTDAAQSFGKIPLDVHGMGVDLASLSGHKLYGPKGIGALYVRATNPRIRLQPLLWGGGHERGLRPGTLNVPAIVGFGAAVRLALAGREAESARVGRLAERLHDGITSRLDGVTRNGHPTERLPGNLNLSFTGVKSDDLMMAMKDIAVSSGSACGSATLRESHVLLAIGVPADRIHSSLRFGLGRFTTAEEIDITIERIVSTVRALRISTSSS